MLPPHHTWHCKCAHYLSATCDDKINDCAFKFSVVCEWRVLIEEDKDTICQNFPRQTLKITNSPKFYPATVLRYMVVEIFGGIEHWHIADKSSKFFPSIFNIHLSSSGHSPNSSPPNNLNSSETELKTHQHFLLDIWPILSNKAVTHLLYY